MLCSTTPPRRKERIYNAVSLKKKHLPMLRSIPEKAAAALRTREAQDYYLHERDFDLSPEAIDPHYLEFFVHMVSGASCRDKKNRRPEVCVSSLVHTLHTNKHAHRSTRLTPLATCTCTAA